jgi:type III secretion protein L
MTLERGRVIKGALPASGAPLPVSTSKLARRIPREALEAQADAARVVAEAEKRALAILTEARAAASRIAEDAAKDAREAEIARVSAELLASRMTEEKRAERELDRIVQVSVLLAERLVGDALRIEPERIAAIAAEALKETRGARRVRIEACAEDVPTLQTLVAQLGLDVAETAGAPELRRGSLVVHTDLGRVDARLEPQLTRLADALREALR